jgi:RNA polymerase sigma-70 factor (ECF subfamily)
VPASEAVLKGLMLRGLAGDGAAQHELLSELARLFPPFFRRRLRDGAGDVDDLVQEVLIAVHTRRATYDPTQPFTAWVYAIARYKMIDHVRRHRGRVFIAIDDAGELAAAETADGGTAMSDLDRLMRELPEGQRAAIRETKLEGLSVSEASARLGMSESAVKVNVHRGLKALAARLGRPAGDPDREGRAR